MVLYSDSAELALIATNAMLIPLTLLTSASVVLIPHCSCRGNPAQTNSFRIARSLAQHVSGRVNISVRSKGFSCIVAKSGLAVTIDLLCDTCSSD